ncbi:hypothetical protein SB861_58445, partial [Paraburkholderia sp. SIMBA_049]
MGSSGFAQPGRTLAAPALNCNLQQMRNTRETGFRYIACMRRACPPLPSGAHKLPLQQENRSEKAHSVHRRRRVGS